jgi:hypothetical protein
MKRGEVLAAYGVTRVLSSIFFGVKAFDPATIAVCATLTPLHPSGQRQDFLA